jgi:Tol biopolymer transport system component
MTFRRARASVLLLWLVACGGGGAKDDRCAIPADGAGFLLYTADVDPDPAGVNFDLRAIRVDGTCDQPVGAGPDYDIAPSWSRATGRLAWAAFRAGQARVVVQPAAGGPQRILDTGAELATGPALSPDGAVVAFERLVPGQATGDVYAIPFAGGTPVELAAGTIVPDPASPGSVLGPCAANDAGPVLSDTAQGRFLYFVSSRASASCRVEDIAHEVWRQPLDAAWAPSGAPERLTTGSAVIGRPAVSPDGRTIAWARPSNQVTSFARVVVRDLATGQERTVTDDSDSEPDFAPAGDALVVKSTRYSPDGDLVIVELSTGAVRKRLTRGESAVGSPAFPR